MSDAPARFAEWTGSNIANDKKHGRNVYRYHPRSDEHPKQICRMVLTDLLAACPALTADAAARHVVGGINVGYTFSNGKTKNLDLAVGVPANPPEEPLGGAPILSGPLSELRISVEAKQCMTEHSKTKPRIFDELSSSHEIVHQGTPQAIAGGIVVVNIADRFASPLRQEATGPLSFTAHKQPKVTDSMVQHLRGLKTRETVNEVGFDAFATIVVNCDNVGGCLLHTEQPAPQLGDMDHYHTFVQRVSRAYQERWGE